METLRGDLGRYFCAWELYENGKDSIIETEWKFVISDENLIVRKCVKRIKYKINNLTGKIY